MKRTSETRQILAEIAVKKLVTKALKRSAELNCLNPGEESYVFATGYLSSVLATVASMSPTALKELERQVK